MSEVGTPSPHNLDTLHGMVASNTHTHTHTIILILDLFYKTGHHSLHIIVTAQYMF